MKTNLVTVPQLIQILLNSKGAKPVTITATTDAKLKAPFASVRKTSVVNGMIGWNYANAVNRLLAKKGETAEFEAQPRHWGVRIQGTPLVEHNGTYYLEMKVEKSLQHVYIDANGQTLTDAQVEPYRPANRSVSPKNSVVLRDYRLDTIDSINMDGMTYKIVH